MSIFESKRDNTPLQKASYARYSALFLC